ncbi:MAG TPA: hypothetical protein VK716_02980 [Terracidiphilus sp.]|jgi:hypothetical protein|nr:hypothetical protein [Terracidiphilus sp.]
MTDARMQNGVLTSDAQLARRLQRLWPHRTHESGTIRSVLCLLGFHHWLQPNYSAFAPRRNIRFCHWCSSVEIDGTLYS